MLKSETIPETGKIQICISANKHIVIRLGNDDHHCKNVSARYNDLLHYCVNEYVLADMYKAK